jgi:hypothetical protein
VIRLIHSPWITLYLAAVGFVALTSTLLWVLMARVNRKLPSEQRIRFLFALGNVQRQYRGLYPTSHFYVFPWVSAAFALALLLAAAVNLGFLIWPWSLFLAAIGFALLANVFTFTLISRINCKAPLDRQIPFLGYAVDEVRRRYRTTYPDSRLYLMPWLSSGLMFACMAAFAIVMIFFNR